MPEHMCLYVLAAPEIPKNSLRIMQMMIKCRLWVGTLPVEHEVQIERALEKHLQGLEVTISKRI